MATMTIRNLPDDVHRRVRFIAGQGGISAEAAVREPLDEATRPGERLGDLVVAYARNLDVDFPDVERNSEPSKRVVEWLNGQQAESLHATAVNVMELRFDIKRLPEGRRRTDLSGESHERHAARSSSRNRSFHPAFFRIPPARSFPSTCGARSSPRA